MKRKPLIILVIFTALHVSCNEASMDNNIEKANGQGERNIQAWHTVSMTFTGGDLNALDSVVTENYIDHTPIGDITGRDSLKSNIMRMRSNFKNIKMKILKELADEEYGFFWMQFSGERVDTASRVSTPFDMTAIQIVRFNDGKAAEHWEYVDRKQIAGNKQ